MLLQQNSLPGTEKSVFLHSPYTSRKERKTMRKKLVSAFMLLTFICAAGLDTRAFAQPADAVVLPVSSEKELTEAVDTVNAAGTGSFIIELHSSITASKALVFQKNHTVLLGKGNTLTFTGSGLIRLVGDETVVELGAADGSDILNITQNNANEEALQVLGGVCSMYEGVRLYGCNPMVGAAMASAVRISKSEAYRSKGTFHMYGGSIDSNVTDGYWGGGAVISETQTAFYMHGGVIENNITRGVSESWGGGVCVVDGGAFYMEGGLIRNNTCEAGSHSTCGGGGVAVARPDLSSIHFGGPLDGFQEIGGVPTFEMTGGTITGNTGVNGGGIYIEGCSASISGGTVSGNTAQRGGGLYADTRRGGGATVTATVLANNTASEEGADIVLYSTVDNVVANLMPAGQMNAVFTADGSNRNITGWYLDEAESRWTPQSAVSAGDTQPIRRRAALIAAYEKLPCYAVSFEFVSGTAGRTLPAQVQALLPEASEYEQGTVVKAPALSRQTVQVPGGVWKFTGWDKASAEVQGDTLFRGTWVFEPQAGGQVQGGSQPQTVKPNPKTSVYR